MEFKTDLANQILEERLDFAIGLVKGMTKKHSLTLTDAEIMENARTLAVSLFIQKESSRRMKK